MVRANPYMRRWYRRTNATAASRSPAATPASKPSSDADHTWELRTEPADGLHPSLRAVRISWYAKDRDCHGHARRVAWGLRRQECQDVNGLVFEHSARSFVWPG